MSEGRVGDPASAGRRPRPSALGVTLLALLLALVGAAGCGGTSSGSGRAGGDGNEAARDRSEVQAAWLNQGAAVEDTWTAAHARARRAVDEALGERVRTEFVEHVALGPEVGQTIDRLVREGTDIIFATSYGFSPFLAEAAARHPDVHFEQARGTSSSPNLGTFGGADEEPLFLAGMAAAGTSKTDLIGFVGTVPEPETVRHVNAFTLGARSVDPSVTVRLAWMGSWYDPEGEAALGRRLAADGAGVLVSGSVSPVLGEIARDHGIGWVGHDADWASRYPDVWITGAVPDWGPYYVRRVTATLDGTWTAGDYYGSMADGFTDLATIGERVPSTVQAAVLDAAAAILEGRQDVFEGPVRDVAGRPRIGTGAVLPHRDRLHMDWLAEGVEEVEPVDRD